MLITGEVSGPPKSFRTGNTRKKEEDFLKMVSAVKMSRGAYRQYLQEYHGEFVDENIAKLIGEYQTIAIQFYGNQNLNYYWSNS